MRKGRFRRNSISIIAFFLTVIVSIIIRLSPAKMHNFTELMSAGLSLSAIATALLFASFSLIPAFSNSRLLKALKDLGTDIKVLDRLLIATTIFVLASVLSLIELFFNKDASSCISVVVTSLWLASLVSGFLEMLAVICLMFKALTYLSQD